MLEIDFHDAEISELKNSPKELEIRFSQIKIISNSQARDESADKVHLVAATIILTGPKYKRLPKRGKLTDGELYGIPGKPLNGRVAINVSYDRACELVLEDERTEYSIHAEKLSIQVELAGIPSELLGH